MRQLWPRAMLCTKSNALRQMNPGPDPAQQCPRTAVFPHDVERGLGSALAPVVLGEPVS